MTSSDGVYENLLKNECALGFMSLPMSSAEKENFFRTHGYPIVELRFAHDALEILVNARNPIRAITVPQLDAVYGRELRAGAPAAITAWSALGGGAQAIKVYSGQLNWGTTRTFQQLVLKGGEFRKDMVLRDVVYSEGIEKEVTERSRRHRLRHPASAQPGGARAGGRGQFRRSGLPRHGRQYLLRQISAAADVFLLRRVRRVWARPAAFSAN